MKNRSLFLEAQKHIPAGVNSPVRAFRAVGGTPVFIEKGKGAFVYDSEGKRYLDFCFSWGPLILGHAPAGLVKTLQETVESGTSFGASTQKEIKLARLIKKAFPSIEKVRLTSSGTEAVMSAIRLARGVTGRKKILKIEGGYHGHVDSLLVRAGSGGATFGRPDSKGIPEELAKLTISIPFNDEGTLKKIFHREGKNLAAFILEPVPANMGVVPPKPGYLELARKLTRKYGALLIFDEVITGFRLAFGGAQERFGIRADLTCLGKVLGGGLPLAAFGGKSELMKELAPEGRVYQAGTLSGNPLATSAAIWMLKSLFPLTPTLSPQGRGKGEGIYAELEKKSQDFYHELTKRIRRFRWPFQLNAVGSMFTLFFTSKPVTDYRSAKTSDTKRFARFFHGLLAHGIYLAPSQFEANFISTAHREEDLRRAEKIFERVLAQIF